MPAIQPRHWRVAVAVLVVVWGMTIPPTAASKVFFGRKQAVELAFPDADRVHDRTEILTAAQMEAIERLSRASLPSQLVRLYTGYRGERVLGHAIIDVGLVRTKEQALLIVLTPAGTVRSVRIAAFHEPLDYLPSDRWFEQFEGKGPADALRPGHDVHAVVNATLTTRAVTDAVRRALAIYQVVLSPDDATPDPAEGGH